MSDSADLDALIARIREELRANGAVAPDKRGRGPAPASERERLLREIRGEPGDGATGLRFAAAFLVPLLMLAALTAGMALL